MILAPIAMRGNTVSRNIRISYVRENLNFIHFMILQETVKGFVERNECKIKNNIIIQNNFQLIFKLRTNKEQIYAIG